MEKNEKYFHNKKIQIVVIIGLLFPAFQVFGQNFRTMALQRIAEKLGVSEFAATLAADSTAYMTMVDGLSVVIRTDTDGQVAHIGIFLFDKDMRKEFPSPVYDCLEHAVLDRVLALSEDDLLFQKIALLKGSWQQLASLQPSESRTISVSIVNEKYFMITWQTDGIEIVSVAIPIDYELLACSSRREMELIFAREVTVDRLLKRPPYNFVEDLLQKYDKDNLYVIPKDTFLTAKLTRNTYYRMTTVTQQVDTITYEEERMGILVDRNYPGETMANLLVSNDPQLPDAVMDIEFQLSNYAKKTVSVTLRQWMAYCLCQGCIPYFIYNTTQEGIVTGSLLMRNRTENYNHLVNLSCNLDDLVSDVPLFEGKAYLYIPNVEASRLFASEPSKKSNEKIFGK